MIERRKYQDGRIGYNSGSDKPNGSKPPWGEVPFDLDKWLQELDPGGWQDEDDKPNGKKVSAPNGPPFMFEEFLQEKQNGFKGTYQDYLDVIDRSPRDYAKKKEGIMRVASAEDEREFYGRLLSPVYKKDYLKSLPLNELKELFDEYLRNTRIG